jgi:hypothetical protein
MNKLTKIILWLIVAIIIIYGIWYGVSKKPASVIEKRADKDRSNFTFNRKFSCGRRIFKKRYDFGFRRS